MSDYITIAVPKGRVFKDVMPLLAKLGIRPVILPDETRKLMLETNRADVKIIVVRATDVPTYVGYGAADIGIVGKDVLLEYDGGGLYELLDLRIARCKMVVAGGKTKTQSEMGRKKVATKYVKTARDYFISQNKQVEIIKLYGSVELAPIFGLADQIVDIVDTGDTLKANGLVELEHITDISSILIANKGAMKMKHAIIKPVVERLKEVVYQDAT